MSKPRIEELARLAMKEFHGHAEIAYITLADQRPCFRASINDVLIKDGTKLIHAFGIGPTAEDAANDYFKRINGMTLILTVNDRPLRTLKM